MVVKSRPVEMANIYWEQAWEVAASHYPAPSGDELAGDRELCAELLFCLLGGHGISYEHNLSAADLLWSLGVLDPDRPALSVERIEAELREPQFAPDRVDGTLRRYRFPARKARLLDDAQLWLQDSPPLAAALRAIPEERWRREFLSQCPGIGKKSASWLLRNTGYARELAVLDIHVLRAMQDCGRLGAANLPRDYEQAEDAYLSWCTEREYDPARFDLLVWDFSRRRQ